eukprot:s6609_g3.t1
MGDVSTAFLHALMNEEVFVWPPKEFYPEGNCLWRLKKAVYGLRQAPKLWQEHFAEVMTTKLGFRSTFSLGLEMTVLRPRLYVLAYVDDLLVVGTDEMRKSFMSQLSEEVLLKEIGQLVPGSEHTFLGRRLRHNGDSIDVRMSQKYIDVILELYGMKDAKPVATTGTVTINKTVPDTPLRTLALSSGEAELYAIGQGVSEALFVRSMLLESKLAKKVSVIAHTDSTVGKSMATRFGTGKKTKHVELRFLYVQNLVQMGLLRMAKIEGTRNPADVMTKYVATDVLQRLKAHIGVVSNWFKGLTTHDTDDHVAPVVNAQWPSPHPPPPECPFPARPRARPECTHCARCFS